MHEDQGRSTGAGRAPERTCWRCRCRTEPTHWRGSPRASRRSIERSAGRSTDALTSGDFRGRKGETLAALRRGRGARAPRVAARRRRRGEARRRGVAPVARPRASPRQRARRARRARSSVPALRSAASRRRGAGARRGAVLGSLSLRRWQHEERRRSARARRASRSCSSARIELRAARGAALDRRDARGVPERRARPLERARQRACRPRRSPPRRARWRTKCGLALPRPRRARAAEAQDGRAARRRPGQRESAAPDRARAQRARGAARRAQRRPSACIVGKGITFDSGGISIKPAARHARHEARHVGRRRGGRRMRAAALLELPLHVVGILAAAENMPGGDGVPAGRHPHDASGQTIEILNTDAEGRLVLCRRAPLRAHAVRARRDHRPRDAHRRLRRGARQVVLGALRQPRQPRRRELRAAGEATGERVWPMPLWDEHEKRSRRGRGPQEHAAAATAGAITAAAFLSRFVGETPWVHLDIAGTAYTSKPVPYQPCGATGVRRPSADRVAAATGQHPAADGLRRWPRRGALRYTRAGSSQEVVHVSPSTGTPDGERVVMLKLAALVGSPLAARADRRWPPRQRRSARRLF